jgi:hypothetical protein
MAMGRLGAFLLVLLTAVHACGCAGTPHDQPPSLLTDPPLTNDARAFDYQLSEREKKLDCKKLTGTMQVRILQIRDYDSRNKASLAARGMQSVVTPIWGGTTEGLDPDGQYRKDLAMLEAYNRQLAAKNCKTFDLAAELKGTGLFDMPTPKEAPKDAHKDAPKDAKKEP